MAQVTIKVQDKAVAHIKLSRTELMEFMQGLAGKDAVEIQTTMLKGAMANIIGTPKFMSHFSNLFNASFGKDVTALMKEAASEIIEEAKDVGRSVFDGQRVHLSNESRAAIKTTFASEGAAIVDESIANLMKDRLKTIKLDEQIKEILHTTVQEVAAASARAMLRTYIQSLDVQKEVAAAMVSGDTIQQDHILAAPAYLQADVDNAPRAMMRVKTSQFYQELARFTTEDVFVYTVRAGQFVYANAQLPFIADDYVPGSILGICLQYSANDAANIETAYYIPRY